MTSPFFGLEIGVRALRTAETLVDITNNNVANADTPGFSRQSAAVQATRSYPVPAANALGKPGQLGTGVEVSSITRARDVFLDYQIRTQLTIQGRWDVQRDALKQVEAIVNEPSSNGLGSLLTKYWRAWQDVSNNPTDSAVRASLVEQGSAVAAAFQNQYNEFHQQQRDIDGQIKDNVSQINTLAQQIADINQQVARVEYDGNHANDLRDQRDQLLDQLSQLIKISYVESSGGEVSIYLGGRQLVDRDVAHTLQATPPTGQQFAQVQWASDGQQATVGDGTVQGLLDSRDSTVSGLQARIDSLNALAARVIQSVNSIHTSGVGLDGKGGLNFFDGTGAGDIAVDAALTGPGGTDHVAAARLYPDATSPTGYSYARGDASNAIALGRLENTIVQGPISPGLQPGNTVGSATVAGVDVYQAAVNSTLTYSVPAGSTTVTISNGTTSVTGALTVGTDASGNQVVTVDASTLGARLTLVAPAGMPLSSVLAGLNGQQVVTAATPSTIGDQYGQQISKIGVDSSSADAQATNQEVLLKQLQRRRDETSGVSIDEETTNLIQYQHAYQAAARVISVMDQMLDTLINGTGLAGRG